MIMSEVFEAKIRKIGNALGIIIPKKVLEKLNAEEGDITPVVIPSGKKKRLDALAEIAGKYKSAKPFKREYEDRY